jgi:hypothetical protein
MTSKCIFMLFTNLFRDTRWYSWLRHCALSRKVAGSILDDVIGNGPGVDSTTNRNWGGGGERRKTKLPHSCADCLEIWDSQRPGTLRAL